MDEAGERPQREEGHSDQPVELEAQRRLGHQLGMQVEAEDPPEPDGHPIAIVVVREDVRGDGVAMASISQGDLAAAGAEPPLPPPATLVRP
jgi:hypothetical protein